MRKIALAAFVVLLFAAGGTLGYKVYAKLSTAQEGPGERPTPPAAVEVGPVTRAGIREIRRLTGTLSAARQGDIGPKITGRISELTVELGDKVSRGQVIARLDSDELDQAVAQVRSDLEVARANLQRTRAEEDQAQREFERIARLAERQVASESDLDAARVALNVRQANVKVAEAEVAQREAALRSAEIRLAYTEVRADWNEGGPHRFVAARLREEGEIVSANETIVSLVDLSTLNALLFVTERDYPRLRIGQTVEVRADAFPEREFAGTVVRMAPRFQESSRQARVEVSVLNKDDILKPGMFVRASVLLQEKEEATLVPTRALVTRDRRPGLFVVDRENRSARFVPVEVGIQEGALTEILSPAIEGEVITLGQNLIDEDTTLTFISPDAPSLPTAGALTDAPPQATAGGGV